MSTEKKHSALPWFSSTGMVGIYAPERDGAMIASTGNKDLQRTVKMSDEENQANTAFIVRACNSHEELVQTLEIVLKSFEAVYNHRADMLKDSAFILPKAFDAWEDVQAAQQALKKARGEV